ncbi:MAG: hypothetical protein SAK29_28975 [Scytonema sp. PMC 1069.18]|nr:hypothetical protein [Scytonema sp. PMC 1069.18]MEC4881395.1 hypothetical protein [Scytonema sp. PMC 1070.18]
MKVKINLRNTTPPIAPYYITHQKEIDNYLEQRRQKAQQQRNQFEKQYNLACSEAAIARSLSTARRIIASRQALLIT